MLRFDKETHVLFYFMFTLSERLSDGLWWSDVLLFFKFKDIVSVFYQTLYTVSILHYII